jgi:transcriptional antiterminator Rof (Rho-off)
LEAKQHKTQEMEKLKQLNITYKLTGDGNDAWKDIPILLAGDKQRDLKLVNSSITHNEDEILELKKQIQLLMQDKNNLQSQANQSQQKTTKLELQIIEKDKEIILLRNDKQSLQRRNSVVQVSIFIR